MEEEKEEEEEDQRYFPIEQSLQSNGVYHCPLLLPKSSSRQL